MSREVRVGIMFVVSLGILGVSLFYLGSFQERVRYRIRFDKVNGLAVDSPVHFNGVPVGRVSRIELSSHTGESNSVPIIVTIALDRSVRDHMKESTVADIKTIGVLGDKYVMIFTPDYAAPPLPEGEFIKPASDNFDMEKLLETGSGVVSDVNEITTNLKQVLNQLVSEDGLIQTLIRDESLAQHTRETLNEVLNRLEADDSVLALLTQDPEFASELRGQSLAMMSGANELVKTYQNADGLVPTLMNDEAYRDEVREKSLAVLDQANQLLTRINDSRGLLYTMTQDEAYGDRIAGNIEKSTAHLASILEKIDQGDGTAALLVNDPSLYKGLYEVVYGLEHSGITKWYIQKKRKKGNRLLEEEKEEDGL